MKKLVKSHVLLQASVVAALVLPAYLRAEYSSVDELASDTGRVESLLKTAKGSPDDLASAAAASVDAKKKAIGMTEQEIDLSKKNKAWVGKIDKLNQIKPFEDIIMQKALGKRESDLKKLKATQAQLGDTTSFVNPQDFNTNDLPKSCKKGVDFSQARKLLDDMNTVPGQYLERQFSEFVKEKSEANKEAKSAKILDAIKHFKELGALKEEVAAKAIDPTKQDLDIEKRIAELNKSNKALKEHHKELTDTTLGEFGKFFGELNKLKENDDRIATIGQQWSKSLESIRKQTEETTVNGIEKLYSNCQKEKKGLIADIEVSKQHIMNYLIQGGTEQNLAAQTAQLDASAQQQRAAQLRCEDVTADVQNIIKGGQLNSILGRMRATKKPGDLLNDAVLAMAEVRNIQQQVGERLRPLMDSCSEVGKARETVKERVSQIAPQGGAAGASAGGAAVARTGSTSRTQSGRSSTH